MRYIGEYNTLEALQTGLAQVFPGEDVEVYYTTNWEEERPHPQMVPGQDVWVRCTERMVWDLKSMTHEYNHRQELRDDKAKIWVLHTDGMPVHVVDLSDNS